MKAPTIMRTALALVLTLLAPLAWGGTYVVVLDPAASGEHVLHDADVTGAGATITGRAYGLLYIDGAAGAATALAAHSGVKYVQPVGDATPPSPVPRPEPEGGRRIVANQAPPTWSSGAYQYDGAGNIYAIGDATLPGGNGTKIAYTYDTLSRLRTVGVSDTGHPSLRNESYTYDPYGNLTGYATPTTSGSIVTNAANNHVTSLGYDQAGSVTSDGTSLQYVRDPLNMIVVNRRVGGTDVNLYTADEERVAEGSGGYWMWSFRGFDQKVLRQYRSPVTNPFAPWLWAEDYVYAGGRLVAAERPAEEGRRRHFHLDHLGTPRLVTGDFGRLISQHDYTAYGIEYGPDSGTASNQEVAAGFDREEPMRFTGHERGFTGGTAGDNAASLDYMHARHYVATMGRFLSVDPVLDMKRTAANPQMWNRYVYVLNGPSRYTDPDGREHVNEPGLTKPMTAENLAMDQNTPAVVRWSFHIEGALLGAATADLLGAGEIYGAVRGLIRLVRAGREEPTLRPDVKASGGRSGQDVKTTTGPRNSLIRGSNGRIYQTNDKGQIIADITKERVKPVTPGQGFGPKREPTEQELSWLEKMARAISGAAK